MFYLASAELAGTWADSGLLGGVIPGSVKGKVVNNDLTNSGRLLVWCEKRGGYHRFSIELACAPDRA